MEGHREGVRVGTAKGLRGQVVMGWEGDGGGLGLPAGYQVAKTGIIDRGAQVQILWFQDMQEFPEMS